MSENARDTRARLGAVGFYGAQIALVSAVIVGLLTFASFKTWTIGRFFAGRAIVLIDAFLMLAVLSVFTLGLSCCGRGLRRWIGITVSTVTIIMIVCTLGMNE